MKKITDFFRSHLPAAVALAVFTLTVTVVAVAQNTGNETVKVRIVKVVDGDTTVIEKTMSETSVQDFTKQFQNIKGKNVQVMITVDSIDKDKKGKQRSAQSMNFNFDMDSSTARAIAKCFVFSDTGTFKTFIWNDTVLKNLPKDFDFKFDFDEERAVNGFDFDIDIDTDKESKTVIMKSGNGKTIVINGGEDNVTITRSEEGEEETRTQTKTLVINDDKSNKKKKVIVSTSVTVMDVEEKGASGRSEKKRSKEEASVNFYPNPSDGNFTLEMELDSKEPARVVITDINGKEVYNEKITGNGKVTKTLNLDGKKGTFIVNIKQGNKNISKKIIIE